MKIVVLAGGLSPERNVSLSSGCMVCAALRERGHEAALIDLYMGTQEKPETLFSASIPEELRKIGRQAPDLEQVEAARGPYRDGQFGPGVLDLCRMADAVFLALHGACGEDGRVQAALDLLGIPYTGSGPRGSAIAMDKNLTKRLLRGVVDTPMWTVCEPTVWGIDSEIKHIVEAQKTRLPRVVKPVDSGSSVGVSIVRTEEELRAALREGRRRWGRCMVEEYVKGREIQVGILDGQPLPPIEIVPRTGFYDYENKYQPGAAEEFCPAPLDSQQTDLVKHAAVKAFRALGLSVYARADFILDGYNRFYFLEINTLPGMTPTSLLPQEAAAVGIGYGELCERIITSSLEARKAGK